LKRLAGEAGVTTVEYALIASAICFGLLGASYTIQALQRVQFQQHQKATKTWRSP
jgi:Flp pilus assembly pilin Flp